MSKFFTKEGLELKRRQINAQEEKVRAIGKEAGQEAGISCDWHDNFGYEDAKRRLEMESANLGRLLEEISDAQVITIQEQNQRVMIGVTVTAFIDGDQKEYTIGAFGESNPNIGLISYTSPLAQALLGMVPGDSKSAHIGGKKVEIEVEEVYPPSHRYHRLLAELIGENSYIEPSKK